MIQICLVLSLVMFVLAALNVGGKIKWEWAGAAFYVAAMLV